MSRRLPVVAMCDGFEVRRTSEGSRKQRHFIEIGGCRIWLHVYLAEKYIRPLLPGEIVHHKDFKHLNDSILNLEIMTRTKHVKIHRPVLGYRFTADQRKKLSESHKGQRAWNKGIKTGLIPWNKMVSEEQLIRFLKEFPLASMRETLNHFKLKSPTTLQIYGGLRRLKEKAKNE